MTSLELPLRRPSCLQEPTSTPYMSFSVSEAYMCSQVAFKFTYEKKKKIRRHARQNLLSDPIRRLPSLRDQSIPAPQTENMFCF